MTVGPSTFGVAIVMEIFEPLRVTAIAPPPRTVALLISTALSGASNLTEPVASTIA